MKFANPRDRDKAQRSGFVPKRRSNERNEPSRNAEANGMKFANPKGSG